MAFFPSNLRGSAAFVTGGTEGIGLALVDRLLAEGMKVIVANRNVKLAGWWIYITNWTSKELQNNVNIDYD